MPSTCCLQGRCSLLWGGYPVSLTELDPLLQVATPGVFSLAPDPWKMRQGGGVSSCPDTGDNGGAQNSTLSWPLGPGWPRREVQSFGWWAQFHPLIMQLHDMLEMHGFLQVVKDMSGYSRQEIILLRYGYPRQGEGAKSKVEVFLEWQSYSGPPPGQAPHEPPKWLPA